MECSESCETGDFNNLFYGLSCVAGTLAGLVGFVGFITGGINIANCVAATSFFSAVLSLVTSVFRMQRAWIAHGSSSYDSTETTYKYTLDCNDHVRRVDVDRNTTHHGAVQSSRNIYNNTYLFCAFILAVIATFVAGGLYKRDDGPNTKAGCAVGICWLMWVIAAVIVYRRTDWKKQSEADLAFKRTQPIYV